MQELPNNMAGLLGGEEDDDIGDVFRLSQMPDGELASQSCQGFLRVAQARHGRIGDAGGYGVDADAMRRQFPRHAACETDNTQFARHIRRGSQ